MLRVFLSSPAMRRIAGGLSLSTLKRGKWENASRLGSLSCGMPTLPSPSSSASSRHSRSTAVAVALTYSSRWNTNDATVDEDVNPSSTTNSNRAGIRRAGNRPPPRRNNLNGSTSTPTLLPPAFDVVHWNDEDIRKGHLLRVVYRDNYVILDYYQQSQVIVVPPGQTPPPRSARAERTVTVALPPGFVARLLGVLEEKSTEASIQLRSTTAVLKSVPEKGKHHHVLQCSTIRANNASGGMESTSTGSEGAADSHGETTDEHESSASTTTSTGAVGQGNTSATTVYEWVVPFDPAESLMLHRFLTQCLQYNTGFCRPILSPSQ